MGVEPPPERGNPLTSDDVDLAAAVQLLPDSGQYPNPKNYPDLTGGLGTAGYDLGQAFYAQLARAIVNGINLTALAQAAGVDPQSLLNSVLTSIPPALVGQVLGSIEIPIPILDQVLGALNPEQLGLLQGVLGLIDLPEVTDGTLGSLLALLGFDLSDPLNLSNLDVPGINVVTAGPTFGVLKMLGVDLGWVPATPNSVADGINGSPYLEVGVAGVLQLVREKLSDDIADGLLGANTPLGGLLGGLLGGSVLQLLNGLGVNSVGGLLTKIDDLLGDVTDPLTNNLPDLVHARIVPSVGVGLGAFAVAMAYQQVIDDLPNQPGGSHYEDTPGNVNPILGSLTVLPMILINNPARPDGGMFARFAPLAALFGIDTVNPRTELTGEGGSGELLGTGLHLGGANVLPILVDVAYEYQPLSDFAAWPNPVTLANNAAAALFPTYMLRGLQLDGLAGQVTSQLANGGVGLNPVSVNLYLTLDSATLPLLEPLYLTSDVLNLVGLNPLAQIPMRLANAIAPAATILTNLGYANVDQENGYERDFSKAGEEVPFMSFPDVDPVRAMNDVFTALVGGIQKEFLSGNPTPSTPNALSSLLGLLSGGGLTGLSSGLSTLANEQVSKSISSLPSTDARIMSLDAGKDDDAKLGKDEESNEQQQSENQPEQQSDGGDAEPNERQEPKEPKGPRHAKPDAEEDAAQPVDPGTTTTVKKRPKHARPDFNVVRDIANHFAPKPKDKPKHSAAGNDEQEPSVEATETPAKAEAGSPDAGAAA